MALTVKFPGSCSRLAFAITAPTHALLNLMQARQASVHTGNPGGLGNTMQTQELVDVLCFNKKNSLFKLRRMFALGPDAPVA